MMDTITFTLSLNADQLTDLRDILFEVAGRSPTVSGGSSVAAEKMRMAHSLKAVLDQIPATVHG